MRHRLCLRCAGMALALLAIASCRPDTVPANAALGAPPVAFDAERAFADLKRQCEFGPRVPGTAGHRRCRDYLSQVLKENADSFEAQEFAFRDGKRSLPMANLIARWKGTRVGARGVILAAHWDTRPSADEESDPARRRQPILGANDGASGVAILLEVARQLKRVPPDGPVWVVLFDGEDYGPGIDRMFLGSRHFARRLPKEAPRVGVLLDMVGDADLRLPIEGYSFRRAREIVQEVWSIARGRGYGMVFVNELGPDVMDDHLPLLDAGVKMIDIIDFDYPYWHTLADTPDKCSANSLRIVGEVVIAWLRQGAPVR